MLYNCRPRDLPALLERETVEIENMKTKLTILLAAVLLCFTACKSTLAPGGAYAPANMTLTTNLDGTITAVFTATAMPDKAFYAADAAFLVTHTSLDAVFKFERDNRAALWKISPEIKHSLDAIRPQAWDAWRMYALARETYKRNPTPAGLTTLQTVLAQAQRLTTAASAAIEAHNQPN